MTDLHEPADFGTRELRGKCKTKLEPRDVSNGGNVITVGVRNIIPDLLERLYVEGYLKSENEPESAADRRVADGRAFQELYQFWHSRGKDFAATEMVYRIMPTLEGHVGSPRDVAETVYHETMICLGVDSRIVYAVCIDGVMADTAEAIRASLWRLPSAMERAEGAISRQLKSDHIQRV